MWFKAAYQMEGAMKLIALLLITLNFSINAKVDYRFKCTNSRSLDDGLIFEVLNNDEAIIKFGKDQDIIKVYLQVLSKNRKEIIYKSDSGSIVSFKVNGDIFELSKLNKLHPLNYTKAQCRLL